MSIFNTQATPSFLQTQPLFSAQQLEGLASAGRIKRIDDDPAGLAIGTSVLANAKSRISPMIEDVNRVNAYQSEQRILSGTKDDLDNVRSLQEQRAQTTENSIARQQINERIDQQVTDIEDRLTTLASSDALAVSEEVTNAVEELDLRSNPGDVEQALQTIEKRQQSVDEDLQALDRDFAFQPESSSEGVFALVNEANQPADQRITTSDLAQEVAGNLVNELKAEPLLAASANQNLDSSSVLKLLDS